MKELVTEKLMTTKELAETLGVSLRTIQQIIAEKGYEIKYAPFQTNGGVQKMACVTEPQATAIKIELQNHSKIAKTGFDTMTVKELATSLNVAEQTVRNIIIELNQVLGAVEKNSQGGYLLNEKQATMIKLKLRERNNLKDNSVVNQITNDLEFMALLKKREEENKILDAYRDMRIAQLTEELNQAKPKVEVYNKICNAENLKTVEEVAKNLGFGKNNFFALLRGKGILFYSNSDGQKINLPKQEYINKGYFVTKEEPFKRGNKDTLYTRVFVTGKGEVWLSQKIIKEA